MDRRRGLRAARASALLLTLLTATGCVGSPSSTSAWQSSSHRTIGTVIAGLGTARIVVREASQGDLQHTYAVVTVTDAIDTSSQEVGTYLVSQPPDRLHAAQHDVTAALQDAVALLVDVRVSLASPGLTDTAAQRLLDSIDAMRHRLDRIDSAVERSPASVGSS